MSGKTTLATQLLNNPEFRKDKETGQLRPCIILDKNLDSRWPKGDDVFLTHRQDLFLQVLENPENYGAIVLIDESSEEVGTHDRELNWLATRGRHYGYQCIFIAQRAMQVNVNVRTQCANYFVFKQGHQDSRVLSMEKAEPAILKAPTFQKGEYVACVGMNPARYKKLF